MQGMIPVEKAKVVESCTAGGETSLIEPGLSGIIQLVSCGELWCLGMQCK